MGALQAVVRRVDRKRETALPRLGTRNGVSRRKEPEHRLAQHAVARVVRRRDLLGRDAQRTRRQQAREDQQSPQRCHGVI